ncbi:MAG TPA: hypothetical protein VGF13_06750 [Verrucomicrobiae bacterium]
MNTRFACGPLLCRRTLTGPGVHVQAADVEHGVGAHFPGLSDPGFDQV